MQRLRVPVDEVADGDVAFGDPRSLIEQPRGLQERVQVDLDQPRAEPFGDAQRGGESAPRPRRCRKNGVGRRAARRGGSRTGCAAPWRRRPRRRGGENGSAASKPSAAASTSSASSAVSVKIDTQSSERQAGTTPRVLIRPRVGFSPIRLLNAAGTRPEPAVSVPSEKLDQPRRHRHRRAGTRPAGDVVGVERAARRAVGRAGAVQPGRELVEIGLADRDGAGRRPAAPPPAPIPPAGRRIPGRRRWWARRRGRCCP